MGAEICIIRTYSESAGTFVPGDCYGLSDGRRRQRALKLDSLALQMVIDRGRAVLLRNLSREKEFATYADIAHTLICAPLMSGKDMIGSITILNKNAGDAFTAPYFTGDDERSFTRLSKYVEKAVVEAMGYMKSKELRKYDEISGLPDNRYFESRLGAEINRASRFESRLVILACETSLRQRGEGLHYRSRYSRLIKCAAATITKTLREYDVVASLGDGRFGIILPQSEDGSVSAVARVKMSVEEALREYGELLPEEEPTLSFAEAHYPDDGLDGSSLMAALRQT
jgi:GGDEF domain-containing protein